MEALKEQLLARVIQDITVSALDGDTEAIEELLGFIPVKNLIEYLPEEQWEEFKALRTQDQSTEEDDKETMLEYIKRVIDDYGSFTIADVEADCSPYIGGTGKFVTQAEDFDADGVRAYTYDPAGFSSDSCDDFAMDWEELGYETIKAIFELAQEWERRNTEDDE